MTKQNQNKPGYKKTKVGWIPEEWSVVKLKELTENENDIVAGPFGSNLKVCDYITKGIPIVRLQNIERNQFIKKDLKFISEEKCKELKYHSFRKGDIILAKLGDPIGKTCIVPDYLEYGIVVADVVRIRLSGKKADKYFYTYILNAPICVNQLKKETIGSTRPRVNISQIRNLKIPYPPLPEQQKIARILSTWDKAIELVGKLIDVKRRLKKGLMQQLLTGKMRFREFRGEQWQEVPLRKFLTFTPRPIPKPATEYKSLGIRSHGKGIFEKIVDDPKKVMMDTLYQVKKDDLIVNITFAWEGAIAIVRKCDEDGLVSHRFPTFVFNYKVMLPEYFKQIILTKHFVYKLGLVSPGGAGRNRVLNKNDFLKLSVFVPQNINEQGKIAAILNGLDKEIDCLNEYLEKLKQQKKGLMQKLLTGKIRVKTNG